MWKHVSCLVCSVAEGESTEWAYHALCTHLCTSGRGGGFSFWLRCVVPLWARVCVHLSGRPLSAPLGVCPGMALPVTHEHWVL